jgi:predicted GNAT family acetyltransferase
MPVIDNVALGRFELAENDHLAFADYQRRDGVLVIDYVESHPLLRGTGAAGRLMEGVVAQARAEGLMIKPLCGYAAAWLRRHPEHGDPLAAP